MELVALIMMSDIRARFGLVIIALFCVLAVIGTGLLDPIAQDIAYHQFADSRQLLGIPNFLNVVSNLGFFAVGVWGVYKILIKPVSNIVDEIRYVYTVLFVGVLFVAVGSSYYHLWPDNQTLVWDRLPMTMAFMALFSIILTEYVSARIGKILFPALLLTGFFSVVYWHFSELAGGGDLRIYILVQYLPLALIPVILFCFSAKFSQSSAYWLLLLAYVIAKMFEHFDAHVFAVLGFISGHSLKHLVAALGLYWLLKSFQRRDPLVAL